MLTNLSFFVTFKDIVLFVVSMRSIAVTVCTDFSWMLVWNLLANLVWHQPAFFYWDGVRHFYWNLVTYFSWLIVTCSLNNHSHNWMAYGFGNIVTFRDCNLSGDLDRHFGADFFHVNRAMWGRCNNWSRCVIWGRCNNWSRCVIWGRCSRIALAISPRLPHHPSPSLLVPQPKQPAFMISCTLMKTVTCKGESVGSFFRIISIIDWVHVRWFDYFNWWWRRSWSRKRMSVLSNNSRFVTSL